MENLNLKIKIHYSQSHERKANSRDITEQLAATAIEAINVIHAPLPGHSVANKAAVAARALKDAAKLAEIESVKLQRALDRSCG